MALLNTLLSHIILMLPYVDWMFLTPIVQSSPWKSEWNCIQIDNAITDIDNTQMGHEFYCDTFLSTIPKLLHFTSWDKTSFAIFMKITPILDKLLEYKRSWIQHVNKMPQNRLPRVMKHYCPTGRRNHGRPLKRLLDTWDRNGSTSGPTAWQIYDDDDDDEKGT